MVEVHWTGTVSRRTRTDTMSAALDVTASVTVDGDGSGGGGGGGGAEYMPAAVARATPAGSATAGAGAGATETGTLEFSLAMLSERFKTLATFNGKHEAAGLGPERTAERGLGSRLPVFSGGKWPFKERQALATSMHDVLRESLRHAGTAEKANFGYAVVTAGQGVGKTRLCLETVKQLRNTLRDAPHSVFSDFDKPLACDAVVLDFGNNSRFDALVDSEAGDASASLGLRVAARLFADTTLHGLCTTYGKHVVAAAASSFDLTRVLQEWYDVRGHCVVAIVLDEYSAIGTQKREAGAAAEGLPDDFAKQLVLSVGRYETEHLEDVSYVPYSSQQRCHAVALLASTYGDPSAMFHSSEYSISEWTGADLPYFKDGTLQALVQAAGVSGWSADLLADARLCGTPRRLALFCEEMLRLQPAPPEPAPSMGAGAITSAGVVSADAELVDAAFSAVVGTQVNVRLPGGGKAHADVLVGFASLALLSETSDIPVAIHVDELGRKVTTMAADLLWTGAVYLDEEGRFALSPIDLIRVVKRIEPMAGPAVLPTCLHTAPLSGEQFEVLDAHLQLARVRAARLAMSSPRVELLCPGHVAAKAAAKMLKRRCVLAELKSLPNVVQTLESKQWTFARKKQAKGAGESKSTTKLRVDPDELDIDYNGALLSGVPVLFAYGEVAFDSVTSVTLMKGHTKPIAIFKQYKHESDTTATKQHAQKAVINWYNLAVEATSKLVGEGEGTQFADAIYVLVCTGKLPWVDAWEGADDDSDDSSGGAAAGGGSGTPCPLDECPKLAIVDGARADAAWPKAVVEYYRLRPIE